MSKDYRIINAQGPRALKTMVQFYLMEGWEPLGSPFTEKVKWMQLFREQSEDQAVEFYEGLIQDHRDGKFPNNDWPGATNSKFNFWDYIDIIIRPFHRQLWFWFSPKKTRFFQAVVKNTENKAGAKKPGNIRDDDGEAVQLDKIRKFIIIQKDNPGPFFPN